MAKLIIAALLSLLVALVPVEGLVNIDGTGCTPIDQQGDCVSTDSTCTNSTGTPTCTCNTGFEPTAAKDACKKSVGEACAADAECITGTACTTVNGAKKCTTLIAGSCSGSDQSTCPDFATCTLSFCVCNSGFIPFLTGSVCAKIAGQNCTADAECMTGTACTTVSGTKKCTTLIDSVCVGTGQSTCPANADCTLLYCKCKSGYTANTAKSMCAQNGAAGVTVSLVVMAAAFITSRFF